MWNTLIILIIMSSVVAMVSGSRYHKKKRGLCSAFLRLITIALFLHVCGSILLPNMRWLLSPLTPSAHIRVIDGSNGKPVPHATALITWHAGWGSVGGGGHEKYTSKTVMTDEKGEFDLPRIFQPLTISFIFVGFEYDDKCINIRIWRDGTLKHLHCYDESTLKANSDITYIYI